EVLQFGLGQGSDHKVSSTILSTKQVSGGGTNQVAGVSWSGPVAETSNDTRRSARYLAAHQAGAASQFVGNGFAARRQRAARRLTLLRLAIQRLHARDLDRGFGQPLASGTARTAR